MRCKKCGEENASAKRCCSNCGAFLEGYTFNNVTGEFGYRESDGSFTVLEKDNMELNKLDELNVREKATMPDLLQFIPNPLRDIQKMNGMDGYILGVKSVCDRIARYIEEYKGIRVFTSVMEIDNVIALLERIRQESGADNIKE